MARLALPNKGQIIRDPVYEYVEVPPRLIPVLEHPLMQRLRRVGQTSMTSTVYPSATGSRFEHSLGAMHLGRRAIQAVARTSPETWHHVLDAAADAIQRLEPASSADYVTDAVGAVALTHDIGHSPFSHALEHQFHDLASEWIEGSLPSPWTSFAEVKVAFHEFAGMELLHQLTADLDPGKDDDDGYGPFLRLVLAISEADPDKDGWASVLHGVVAGELDVDRIDYIMRDAQRAGTEFGSVDYIRLVDNTEMHTLDSKHTRFALGVGAHARSAAETLLLQRVQSYRWITFHHRVVASNAALGSSFRHLLSLSTDDTSFRLTDGRRVKLAEMFTTDRGVLNYLRSGGKPRQLGLMGDEPLMDPPDTSLAQARVDDGLVTQLLADGLMVAESLIAAAHESSTSEDIYFRLREFVSLARSFLLREKRLVPVWKTVDEWKRLVTDFFEDGSVVSTMDMAIGELETRYGDEPRAAELVRLIGRATVEALADDTARVAATNRVLSGLLAHGLYRNELRQRLMTDKTVIEQRRFSGSWVVTYQGFSPTRIEGRVATLFFKNDAEALRVGSPLVAALEEAEEHRVNTLLFFLAHDMDVMGELIEKGVLKTTLRETVRAVLPRFLAETWPRRVEAIAKSLIDG